MQIRPFNLLLNANISKHVEQFILLLTCLCVYSPGWWAQEFVFDDREAILNNPVVTGKKHWSEVLWRDYWGHPIALSSSHKSYRPVTTLTFVLEHAAFGLQPFVHRITNIFLHALVTLQIYKLVAKLLNLFKIKQKERENTSAYLSNSNDCTISKEFLVAMVFAVHPIHSEAVCNIVGRAELLMNLLQPPMIVYFALAALSMFSKEQGIVILPICIVFDWLAPDHNTKRLIKHRSILLLCVLFFLLILRVYINNFQTPIFSKEDNPAAFLPTAHMRALNYLYIWLLNIWLLVKPNQLSFDYSSGCVPIINTVFEKRSFICLLTVLMSSLVLASYTYRLDCGKNKHRLFIFLTLFGSLTFLPSSNLLVTVGFTLAERVLYLPSFPLFIWC
uniref:DUF1736 domain-containing protein n=1 Tax=Ditylenchus dipsaci TaxID=166011 RepID=A0A915ENY5_9BILA